MKTTRRFNLPSAEKYEKLRLLSSIFQFSESNEGFHFVYFYLFIFLLFLSYIFSVYLRSVSHLERENVCVWTEKPTKKSVFCNHKSYNLVTEKHGKMRKIKAKQSAEIMYT